SVPMCGPGTGAPASATEPVSAHASTSGASRASSAASGGASSSYPVSDSSGKTTTRAPARRTRAACARAFAATSKETHSGWATARRSGTRLIRLSCRCMRVLVVGGSGYVGGLVLPLLAKRHAVRVLDLRPPPDAVDYDAVDYLEGSATDYPTLRRATEGVDAVVHCAMATEERMRTPGGIAAAF